MATSLFMGKVTIQIQHSWTMQPSKPQEETHISRPASACVLQHAKPVTPKKTNTTPLPLAAQVRITIPSTIAQLVSFYNTCDKPKAKRECDAACRDVLDRMEHMVLASQIMDPIRRDNIRSRLETGKSFQKESSVVSEKTRHFATPSGKPRQLTTQTFSKETSVALEKTRHFATEARISVLMLSRCRSKHIRHRAMELLCEALDTNTLSVRDHEIMQLQMLWVELVHVLRQYIDAQRAQSSLQQYQNKQHGQRRMSKVYKGPSTVEETVNNLIHHATDQRVSIDFYIESILIVFVLI